MLEGKAQAKCNTVTASRYETEKLPGRVEAVILNSYIIL
jgi:hypothetical protein